MKLRIGTRSSPLALFQAHLLSKRLNQINIETELIKVDSEGDKNLTQPIYEMGVVGVFTKALDVALINRKIDVAVHSLKDVPTKLPKNITLTAFLERGNPYDTIVYKDSFRENENQILATGSLRRRAFWANRYQNTRFENLRGNLQTRIKKLENNHWTAAIFAQAGLDRSDLELEQKNLKTKKLEWMLPAPSQGIIAATCLESESEIKNLIDQLSHNETEFKANLERSFLRRLEGGCSMPIGIQTIINNDTCKVHAAVLTTDGKKRADIQKIVPFKNPEEQGILIADELLNSGGAPIVEMIKLG